MEAVSSRFTFEFTAGEKLLLECPEHIPGRATESDLDMGEVNVPAAKGNRTATVHPTSQKKAQQMEVVARRLGKPLKKGRKYKAVISLYGLRKQAPPVCKSEAIKH
jgi:hypothetical protein